MPRTLILNLCYCSVLPVSTRRPLTYANLVSRGASLMQEIQDYEEEVEATRRAAAEAAETAKRRSAAEPEMAPEIEDEVPLSMSREFLSFYHQPLALPCLHGCVPPHSGPIPSLGFYWTARKQATRASGEAKHAFQGTWRALWTLT